jgi:hypothetical protein
MKKIFIFFLILGFFTAVQGFAQEAGDRTPAQASENMGQDKEVMERAKAHRYKGGAEEGELRVQGQLAKPQRKIAPVVDRNEDKESQEHD